MFYRRERDKLQKTEIKNGKEGKQEEEDQLIKRGESGGGIGNKKQVERVKVEKQ